MDRGFKQCAAAYLRIILACAIYALGFNWCYAPNGIAFGGITGLGQILHRAVPVLPVGAAVIVLNVPLFLLGGRLLGKRLLISSLFAMAVSSVFIDLLDMLWRFSPMEPLLAGIFGGALVGLALGIVFRQGATTGGTDLAARLMKLALPWVPMGSLLLGVDLAVIAAVALAFRSMDSALYGVISLYVLARVMDGVLYGLDIARVAYIISADAQQITAAVIRDLGRGVTVLSGRGGYSGEQRQVLLIAFRQRQIVALKQTVKGIDPDAFLIVCPAHEVHGDGFRKHQQHDL